MAARSFPNTLPTLALSSRKNAFGPPCCSAGIEYGTAAVDDEGVDDPRVRLLPEHPVRRDTAATTLSVDVAPQPPMRTECPIPARSASHSDGQIWARQLACSWCSLRAPRQSATANPTPRTIAAIRQAKKTKVPPLIGSTA